MVTETASNQFGGVAEIYDDLMSRVPYACWIDYLELLWKWYGLKPHAVLDLACGTGTVTELLLKRGLDLGGVDLSRSMLQVARCKLPARIPLWQQDLAELDLPRTGWDAAICLFDSLNYILDPERLGEAFRRVRSHLAPGGCFIFDLNAPLSLRTGMFNQKGSNARTGLAYFWRSEWNEEESLCTIRMEFRFPRSGKTKVIHEVHQQRAYTLPQIRDLLEQAGFEVKGEFEAYTLRPPRGRTDRYHIVAIAP